MYDKIINKALSDANEIKENGKIKAQKLTNDLLEETNNKIALMLSEAAQKNIDMINGKNAELEQQLKQEVLAIKKNIIKDVFNKALDKLLKMNDKDFEVFFKTYLSKANLKGKITLRVNKNDYNKYNNLINKLKFDNLDINLSNSYVPIIGGFIIEGEYFDIDNSYEVILNNLNETLEVEIANKLFTNEA